MSDEERSACPSGDGATLDVVNFDTQLSRVISYASEKFGLNNPTCVWSGVGEPSPKECMLNELTLFYQTKDTIDSDVLSDSWNNGDAKKDPWVAECRTLMENFDSTVADVVEALVKTDSCSGEDRKLVENGDEPESREITARSGMVSITAFNDYAGQIGLSIKVYDPTGETLQVES